jgi:hypothetical protein
MTRLDFTRLSARKKQKMSDSSKDKTEPKAAVPPPAPKPRLLQTYPKESLRVLESVASAPAESKRLLKQTPGFRRSFGASFGGNGQLVIPRADGTIHIILEPSGAVRPVVLEAELSNYKGTPAAENPRFCDGRVAGYSKATDKRKSPRRDVVFRLLASVVGPAQPPLVRERDLVRDRMQAVQNGRRERLDDWVRCCLGRMGVSGLQAGDALSECQRALKKGSLDELRAATVLSQAPNLGLFSFSKLEGSKPPKALGSVIEAIRGRSAREKDSKGWIEDFGMALWYRKHALDPLSSIVSEIEWRKGGGREPNDGCFAFLKFIASPSPEQFSRMLMSLRDDVSDWSLSFHVARVLLESGVADLSPRKASLLTMQFAHQLERAGLWHWAIYLCMRVSSHVTDVQRKRAVYELLCRHLPSKDSHPSVRFVREVCRVGEPYLNYARAIQGCYFRPVDKEVILKRFAAAGELNECVHVFASYVGPRLIFKEQMQEFKHQVESMGLTRDRPSSYWHFHVAWQWLYLQMGFVYVRSALEEMRAKQRTIKDFLEVFSDFAESLSSYSSTVFPQLRQARPLIYTMGDWMASCASGMVSQGTINVQEMGLVKVLTLPMSPDTRRMMMIKHSAAVARLESR